MKPNYLKSLMLIVALMASFQFNAFAQNAFAYDISAAATSDPSVCQVTYSLNAAATSAVIEVYSNDDKETKLFEVAGTTSAGVNTVDVSFMGKNVPLGTYWFKIRVTSTNVSQPQINSKIVKMWSPYGIAIDNHPESEHFGRILITESHVGINNQTSGYVSSQDVGIGVGIYAFDPQLNCIKNSNGKNGFTGGLTLATASDTYPSGSKVLDPKRIEYSEDGTRLFLSRAGVKAPGVYELNPDNLEAGAKSIFSGTLDTSTGLISTSSGTVITGPAHGMDVYGSGSNLKIAVYAIETGYTPLTSKGQLGKAFVYNLGNATSWTTAPSHTLDILNYGSYECAWLTNEYAGVLFDKDAKGVFIYQGRDNPGQVSGGTSTTGTLKDYSYLHFNLTNNTADYADVSKRKISIMEWNHDKTLLAIQQYNDEDYNSDGTSTKAGRIKVYRVTYNNDGTHLTWGAPIYDDVVTNVGYNVTTLAWDYANNLYFGGNSNEYVGSIAMPRTSGDVTTPARSSVTFDLTAIGASNVWAVGVMTEAATSAKSIDVTWGAPAHGTISSYEVQYKTSSQTTWTSLGTVTSTSYTYDLAADVQVGETYTFNIIPTFTTGEVGASASSNTVTDYASSIPVDVVTSQQKDSEGRYSFNLAVDAIINSANIAKTTCYDVNAIDLASKYILVITQELADIATSVTDANGNALTVQYGSVVSAENGVETTQDAYFVEVDADATTKDMPTVIFHNVEPTATYPIEVYLNAYSSTDENVGDLTSTGWAYLHYTKASVTSVAMVMPGTTFSFGNASIVTLDENPVTTANDDMPMGSFRQIDSDDPTNAVTYNKANYIATSGSVVGALNVTDEVLENWAVTYDIDLVHGTTTHEYNGVPASNTQIMVDFAYLPIDYTEVNGEDNRGYNRANDNTTFVAKVGVNYTRNDATQTIADATAGSELVLTSSELVPAIEISNSSGALIKKTETHFDDNCKDTDGNYINDGYYKTYYDATLQLTWSAPNTYHLIGYYANAIQNGSPLHCWGHYLSDENGDRVNNTWIEFVQGSVLTDTQISTINTNILSGIGYTGANNWAELANVGSLPLFVHYVYATNEDDMLDGESASINVWISADYPILMKTKPQMIVSGAAAIDDTTPTMTVIQSMPYSSTSISLNNQNVTTGVERIMIESQNSNVKYYNLHGVEVVNPSNGVFIKIEGEKASKVIIK